MGGSPHWSPVDYPPQMASDTEKFPFHGIIIACAHNMCMRPANGKRRYNVTSFLIGWAYAQNNPYRGSVVKYVSAQS